jgi:hypothetical protein
MREMRDQKFEIPNTLALSLQTVSLVSPFPPVSRAITVFPQPAQFPTLK